MQTIKEKIQKAIEEAFPNNPFKIEFNQNSFMIDVIFYEVAQPEKSIDFFNKVNNISDRLFPDFEYQLMAITSQELSPETKKVVNTFIHLYDNPCNVSNADKNHCMKVETLNRTNISNSNTSSIDRSFEYAIAV